MASVLMNKKGFTLIELMVVIGIISIIISIVIAGGKSFNRTINLEDASKAVETKIKLAKSKSIGAYDGTNYGMHFENNRVVVFAGSVFTDGAPANEIYILPDDIEIYGINLAGGGSDVVFERLTGETANYGTVGLRIISDNSKTKQITINAEGQSGTQSFTSSANSPIENARHVHFNLGWNIQNANILRLEWVDEFDAVITMNNIDTASYFNGDKTAFDWRGTTDVSGLSQTMRVHSWLDALNNTVLCVMRDQSETEKLNVYFVDGVTKKISTYTKNADGTITVEPDLVYGGTMEIE